LIAVTLARSVGKIATLRVSAMAHLANLRKLVSKPENVEPTRAVLAEHFGTFKLEPVNESGELKYCAHWKVDFFRGEKLARTGGAGGPAGTMMPQT
jgi:hypothetical protein